MNRRRPFPVLTLILLLASTASADEAVSAEDAAAPESPVVSEDGAPPKWLVRAEKAYDEGVKAQETGNAALAARKYKASLKALAHISDDDTALDLKDEIGALFAKIEERLAGRTAAADDGLAVSDQELRDAPAAETPAVEGTFTIPVDADDPLVKKYVGLYTGPRRREMGEALARLALYKGMILRRLKDAGLPRELVYLTIAESEVKNAAVSRAGAVGLWQLMSGTGRKLGLKINYWVDERRDPEKSTDAALRYLKDLHDWFDDWPLALAAYNRGEYGIERDMKTSRSPDFGRLAQRKALPRETENYVPKFVACALIADDPAAYGIDVKELAPDPYDEVPLDKPLDLRIAAECSGSTEKKLQELNPTLRLWCTPKTDPHFPLRVPAGTREKFLTALAQVKDWTPSSGVVKYRVQKGDFLGRIAKRYRTTVQIIQRDNRIRNPQALRTGQMLVIRPGARFQGE